MATKPKRPLRTISGRVPESDYVVFNSIIRARGETMGSAVRKFVDETIRAADQELDAQKRADLRAAAAPATTRTTVRRRVRRGAA